MDAALGEALDEAWVDIGEDYGAALRGADPDKAFKFAVAARVTIAPQGGDYVVKARVSSGRRRSHDAAPRVARREGGAA